MDERANPPARGAFWSGLAQERWAAELPVSGELIDDGERRRRTPMTKACGNIAWLECR